MQKSSRTGSVNLEKVYEVINGENIVTKIENGATVKVNTTKLRNEALVKKELIERQKKAKVELARAKQAQEVYNKPFEEVLSNKSAERSAGVFLSQQIRPAMVENNGDFRQRLNYIHTIKSSANLDWRIADSLKSLNPKTVDSLSDDFINELFNIEIDPKVLASNLEFIEVNFSASELEKITKNDTGIKLLLDVLTDKLGEGTELGIAYKALHKMGK